MPFTGLDQLEYIFQTVVKNTKLKKIPALYCPWYMYYKLTSCETEIRHSVHIRSNIKFALLTIMRILSSIMYFCSLDVFFDK